MKSLSLWERIRALFDPAYPPELADELAVRQFVQVRQLIPVLYLTIAVISISAGLAARHNLPDVFQFGLPAFFVILSFIRYRSWRRKPSAGVLPHEARRNLRSIFLATFPMALAGALAAVLGYFLSVEAARALPPMFIMLAVFACANCLSSHPRAAISTLLVGMTPVVGTMLIWGDRGIAGIAITMIVVGLLQMRFIHVKFCEMVKNMTLQRDMRLLAETDPLTGLSNRRAFTNALDTRLAVSGSDTLFGVAMIDLDGFKPANDRHGHATGDALLIEVARRLKALGAAEECVARIGGDEFAILFAGASDPAVYAEKAAAIRSVISLPYAVDELLISLSASVGVSHFPRDGRTVSSLLKAADRALYAEKAKLYDSDEDDEEGQQISLFG